ncbi:hypothetical protein DSLASN_47140 [Desulfoluna limicola]|uniref:Uncharacterized protein n=1 Tax=Desulfoluna limicola TaxID=2810562 RepID=A0ABM7PPB3_9BACT|nr:hypothetical protein DSLASN_47140 [Desulfoluna limicola]
MYWRGERTKKHASGGQVEAPGNLIAIALCPSFLGSNRNGVRRGLRPPPKLEVSQTLLQASQGVGSCFQTLSQEAQPPS